MTRGKSLASTSSLVFILCLSWAVAPVSAQEETGNLYGIVTDTAGELLPGATVELAGMGAPRYQTADGNGQFRFLGLDPGRYIVTASLSGFSTVEQPNIDIRVAQNTRIDLQLFPAIEEIISVTAESPLLDERKLSAGTRVSRVELETIPTARDPWAILNQAPGVLNPDVNVGGSSSGMQPFVRGQGTSMDTNDYIVDGVQVTDMWFSGGAATYFDFDQFEEIQITTGGNDLAKNTAGIGINMVTKRGTNEFRGSARFLLTDDAGYFGVLEQANSGFDESELGPGQEDFVPNNADRIQDIGFEAGGPAWRDRAWLWGTWGQNDITIVSGSGQKDRTVLENVAIKLNAQLSRSNSFVASYSSGNKRVVGRNAGVLIDPSATWNQNGPTGITKLEDSHVFGSNLFLSGQYSYQEGEFSLLAQGGCGLNQPPIPFPGGEKNVDANGYVTNNACGGRDSPQTEWKLDGSYFFSTSSLNHELKFGGRTRESVEEQAWSYPGRNIFHYDGSYVGVQDPGLLAWLGLPPERADDAHMVYAYRQGPVPLVGTYDSLWIQDTMTRGPWTFNVGLRYDLQDVENPPGTVDANPAFPEVMPPLVFEGNDAGGIYWSSLSPRLGVTYALGEERKTLLRGSFSQYPAPLSSAVAGRVNPVGGQLALILFLDDPGGYPSFYDEGETWSVLGGAWGFDPDNPTELVTANENDPDMDPELTRELIVGVEHAFLPELVAALKVTWRNTSRIHEYQRLFRDSASGEVTTIPATEYVPDRVVSGLLPDGSPYDVQTWAADPAEWTYTGGNYYTDGDREVDYLGASVTVTKRLANQWMARGFVNYNFDESWQVPESYFANNDPNRTFMDDDQGFSLDGQIYAPRNLNSNWQWNLNGMYQVAPDRPWGFNVAGNLGGRQGVPIGYRRWVIGLDRIGRWILVEPTLGDFRNDDFATVDLRLEKEFRTTGSLGLVFSIDGFNILNTGAVLRRNDNLGSPTGQWVLETISPRIWRLGVRLSWR